MEHKKESFELSTPNAIILAGIIIAGAIIFTSSYKSSGSNDTKDLAQTLLQELSQTLLHHSKATT